jgi:hypothetical protein
MMTVSAGREQFLVQSWKHLSADTLSVHCDNFTLQHDQSLPKFKFISSQAFVPNSSDSNYMQKSRRGRPFQRVG